MKGQHFSSWSAIGAAFKKRREQTLSSSLKLSDFSFPPPPPSPPSSAIATSPLASAAAISVTAVGIAASSTPGFNKSFDDFFVPLSQRERKHQTLIEQLLALVSPVGGRRPAHVTLALDAPQSTQTSSAAFDSASVSAETRALSRRAGKAAQFFDKVLKAINHHIQERRSGAAGALTIDIEAVLQHSPWKQILARAEEVKISQQLAANAIELKNMAGRALTETIVGVLAKDIPRQTAADMLKITPVRIDSCRKMTMQAQLCQWHLGLDVVVEDSSVQMDNLDVVAADSSMQVNHPCLDVAVHALDASQQQLQEHTVIDEQTRNVVDEQPRNVVDGELGAGEELPGVDTFIVFEWVDYDGDRKKRVRSKSRKREVKKFSLGKVTKVDSVVLVNVWGHSSGSNQYTGKYLPAWLHGQEEKQSINDPSTEDKKFKAWEKDVLASHIISLDICMQPSGEIEGSSLQIASTDQEHIKKDLRLYNCT
eukprot:g14460.t1